MDEGVNINQRDAELAKRAKTDHLAFEQLYDLYFPKIYGYVFKRVGHRETTEDIVSISFTKAFTNLHTFNDAEGGFRAWLYKIATNTVIDHYRKNGSKSNVPIEAVEHVLEDSNATDREIEVSLIGKRLDQAIQKLSKTDQEIIHLKYFAEYTNQEIAEYLNISSNNSGVKIYRALAKLKSAYHSL